MRLVSMVGRGAVAGVAATLAMDLLWFRRSRRNGGTDPFIDWELSRSTTSFDDAGAPARVGRRLAGLVGVDLPDSSAATVNNLVHWATGVGWGKAAGAAGAALPVPPLAVGVATGVAAFATSYATLAPLGVYRPIWEYDRATLWQDLSAHLVFGTALGLGLTALRVSAPPRR